MRGDGSKRKGLLEIKKVGLDREKWLVSESFGETSTKEKINKYRKGLGRKRVKVGEYWSRWKLGEWWRIVAGAAGVERAL